MSWSFFSVIEWFSRGALLWEGSLAWPRLPWDGGSRQGHTRTPQKRNVQKEERYDSMWKKKKRWYCWYYLVSPNR